MATVMRSTTQHVYFCCKHPLMTWIDRTRVITETKINQSATYSITRGWSVKVSFNVSHPLRSVETTSQSEHTWWINSYNHSIPMRLKQTQWYIIKINKLHKRWALNYILVCSWSSSWHCSNVSLSRNGLWLICVDIRSHPPEEDRQLKQPLLISLTHVYA